MSCIKLIVRYMTQSLKIKSEDLKSVCIITIFCKIKGTKKI